MENHNIRLENCLYVVYICIRELQRHDQNLNYSKNRQIIPVFHSTIAITSFPNKSNGRYTILITLVTSHISMGGLIIWMLYGVSPNPQCTDITEGNKTQLISTSQPNPQCTGKMRPRR